MANRAAKLAKLKSGPGVFIYVGGEFDTETVPTPVRQGRNQPKLGSDNMPIFDSSGRQVFEQVGELLRDKNGRPVLGGPPVVKRTPLESFRVWGVEFKKGERVEVDDDDLALKLRCRKSFKEVLPGEGVKPVSELTREELVSLARNEGIKLPTNASKAVIASLVSGAQAGI